MLHLQTINDINQSEKLIPEEKTSLNAHPDPQVKVKKEPQVRRTFSNAQKLRFLEAFDACENASARGEFLRKEGLYYAAIADWKRALASGKLTGQSKSKTESKKMAQLLRENERLKKRLRHVNIALEFQKKVSELFGLEMPQIDETEVE